MHILKRFIHIPAISDGLYLTHQSVTPSNFAASSMLTGCPLSGSCSYSRYNTLQYASSWAFEMAACNMAATFGSCASENASSKATHLSRFVITHLRFKAGRYSICHINYHFSARISACQSSHKEDHHVSVYRKFV